MKTKTRRYKTKKRKTRRGGMNFFFGKSSNKYDEVIANAEKLKTSSESIFNKDVLSMSIKQIIDEAKILKSKETPLQDQSTPVQSLNKTI
jgi:hypothetical protein